MEGFYRAASSLRRRRTCTLQHKCGVVRNVFGAISLGERGPPTHLPVRGALLYILSVARWGFSAKRHILFVVVTFWSEGSVKTVAGCEIIHLSPNLKKTKTYGSGIA